MSMPDTSFLALHRQIDTAAAEVGELLRRTGLKVVTAESCTGGGLAEAFTRIAGSSAWFDRGYITYSNEAKAEMLGVPMTLIEQHGAVSEAVAREMALGAVRQSRAHVSISVTGVAGPDGGTPGKPVGTVWFAWGQKRGYAEAVVQRITGDRATVRARSVLFALDGLRQRLSQ